MKRQSHAEKVMALAKVQGVLRSRDLAAHGMTRATFKRRGTALPAKIPLGLSDAFAADAGKQAQWRAFVKRSRLQVRISFGFRVSDSVLPAFP